MHHSWKNAHRKPFSQAGFEAMWILDEDLTDKTSLVRIR